MANESRNIDSGSETASITIIGTVNAGVAPNGIAIILALTAIKPVLGEVLRTFSLLQKYFNPFSPATVVAFELTGENLVGLKIYELQGTEVVSFLQQKLPVVWYRITRYARDFPVAFICFARAPAILPIREA